jgi:hypothetical protein
MTANIFDEIDPSGKYLNFVRKFYRYSKCKETCEVPGNNILYVYGYGPNVKLPFSIVYGSLLIIKLE